MDQERWHKINEVFATWLDLESEKQSRFLTEACGDDETFRSEVQALIDAHLQAQDFIENPVVAITQEEDILEIDQQIGPYKILKEIGRGGMGAVYLAARADQEYKKQVAIKLIKRGMDTEQVLHRFRNERQILANFDHPNIARLLEGGSTPNGLPYFVMEYVEGRPIDDYCDENNLSITKRLELFLQVCAAVSYAHRNLVVHRDIKPSNILVTAEGLPKLLDFGIAKILQPHSGERTTATGFLPMTPEYASPEQALGGNVTTYSDIYSLGVLLYELLTGHLPYQVKAVPAMEVARIITETKPQAPSTIVNTVVEDLTPETVSKCREGTPERLRRRLRGDLDNIVLMAMRKEPHRRYQSVEQFSEDIRRHLDGHPVLARKDTFLYRGTKFIKRNKVASALALLALISFAITGIVRWRTNQQAASFQEFGQEVTRMEAIMRYAYLLPLHDTTKEAQIVEQRIVTLKRRMNEIGSAASGPGHYALGRGYMALNRYEEAKDHLNQAWNNYGYQEPQVAYALGLTYTALYRDALQKSESISSKEAREARLREIEKQFRDPALQLIAKSGTSATETPDYVHALMHFLEKKYDRALAASGTAVQKLPWLYEAWKIQGDIYSAQAIASRDTGEFKQASEAFKKAEEAYQRSIVGGSSDSENYESLCTMRLNNLRMHVHLMGESPDSYLDQTLQACNGAIQAWPKNANAYLLQSFALSDLSFYEWTHGKDPKLTIENTIKTAQKSLQWEQSNPQAYRAIGNAYWNLAEYQAIKGEDPIPLNEKAASYYQKALELNPSDPLAYYAVGKNYASRGAFEQTLGRDPRKSFDTGIRFIQRALAFDSLKSTALADIGMSYKLIGEYEMNTGLDPRRSFEQGASSLEESLKINPADPYVQIILGNVLTYQAEFENLMKKDPTSFLKRSLEVYRKVAEATPNDAYPFGGMSDAYRIQAEYDLENQRDPSAMIENSRKNRLKSYSLNEEMLYANPELARLDLISAKWKILKKQSPEQDFRDAKKHLVKLRLNPSEMENRYLVELLLYQLMADYQLPKKESCAATISKGLKLAEEAITHFPRAAEGHAIRGTLFLLRAKIESGKEQKNSAQLAKESFQKAFELNKNLLPRYQSLLNEATTILAQ